MGKQQFAIAFLSLVIFLASSHLVAAQITGNGKCPAITTRVGNLNFDKFQGLWRQRSAIPTPFERGSICQTMEFYPLGNNQYSALIQQTTNGRTTSIRGSGTIANSQLLTTFNTPQGRVTMNFVVLATDYSSAALYSCTEAGGKHTIYAYVIARFKDTNIGAASQALARTGVRAQPITQTCIG